MMKKITLLLLLLLTVSFGYSQSLPIDFSDPLDNNFVGPGAVGDASVFSLDVSPTDGANAVGKIVGGAAQYDSRIDLALDTYIDMTTANKTFTFEFYTTEAVVMTGLFQIGNKKAGGAEEWPIEMGFTTDGNIGWQTITLDFNSATNGFPNAGNPVEYGQYAQVSVFTDFAVTTTSTYYVDDIAGAANGGAVVSDPVPAAGPADPSARATEDYISFYNGIYTPTGDEYVNETNVTIDAFVPGSTVVGDVLLVDGNTVVKYKNHNYSGIGGSDLGYNVKAMEYLHIDVWFDVAPLEFQLKLEDQTGAGGGQVIIAEIAPASGEWISYDIDLSLFTDADLAKLKWIIPITPGTANIMYFDNIHFWRTPVDPATVATLDNLKVDNVLIPDFDPATLDYTYIYAQGTVDIPVISALETNVAAEMIITQALTLPGAATVVVTSVDMSTTLTYTVTFEEIVPVPVPLTSAPLSNTPDSDVLFLYSDVYTTTSASFTNPTWAVVGPSNYSDPSTEVVIAGTSDNIRYFEDVVLLYMQAPLDATTYRYFHIDIWSGDSNNAFIKWESSAAGQAHGANFTLIPGEWNSIDIDLDTFGIFSTVANRAMFQLIVEGTSGLDYYFDNIYFSKSASTLSIKDYEIEGLMAYPNPSNSKWTISTKDQEIQAIDVFNVLGKRVLSLKPNTLSVNVDASSLAPGVYISTITTEKGTSSRKLIKN